MDSIKLKKCKALDLDSKFKEYFIKSDDKSNMTDSLKEFFSQMSQNRIVMTKMEDIQEICKAPEQFKKNISIITFYINQINLIRKKIIFGKEKFCCKIDFAWSDTIKGSTIKSNFIEFELCNSIYNLATLYYYNGINLTFSQSITKEIRKEASKNFKYAMYLYNWIKEGVKKLPEKEIPFDLYSSYLDYLITLCEIKGQMQIYRIAKETNPKDFTLHSKLILYASDLYKKLEDLYSNIQGKKPNSEIITLYQNRFLYYKSKMFLELKNEGKRKFDEKGVGYGEVCYFQNKALIYLLECQKTIKKLTKFLKIEKFEDELQKVSEEKKVVDDLNNRLYHEALPKEDKIQIESKNMMSMVLPEKLYLDENESKAKEDEKLNCPDLDLLAPKEVKEMLGNYKPKINELITKNLDKYENEGTISNFIQELDLPKKLTKMPLKEGELEEPEEENDPRRQLPQELWEKIEKVQKLGGGNGLIQIMQRIMGKSTFLIDNLKNLLNSFELEDKDDQSCRMRFKDKWIREPSIKLNYQMVQAAHQYIKSIQQTQVFDNQANDDINNNSYYFERLMSPLEELNRNIPLEKIVNVEDSPEEKEVKTEILKLYQLGDKCTEIIKPIFNEINDDSIIIGSFMEVLNRKTTEQAIYEKNKNEYLAKFDKLKNISDEVKKQEEIITELVNKNREKIMPKSNEYEENRIIEYFRHLDQLTNMFMEKYEKIMKGDAYYNGLKEKVDKLVKFGNDWMIKRNDEKNALLKYMGGRMSCPIINNGFGGGGF